MSKIVGQKTAPFIQRHHFSGYCLSADQKTEESMIKERYWKSVLKT
jgi:hypothetical protein